MTNRLLPPHIDNDYQGHKLALWLFALLLFVKTAMSVNSVLNGYDVAGTADGIPLETYTPAGARAVVTMFAAWGLSQLFICLLCILVMARYRAMIPLMFALLLLEHLCRRLIFWVMPIERRGTPPGIYINLALTALMVVGLLLSLRSRRSTRSQ